MSDLPRCPSGKRVYRRRRYALIALRHLQTMLPTGRAKCRRAYRCDQCGFFHLTKQTTTRKDSL